MERLMQRRDVLFISVMALLVLVGTYVLPVAAAQPAQSDTQRTITVSGIGQASGTPDIAYIQIGTEQINSDPTAAFNDANRIMNAARDAETGLNIAASDIQTTTFNMWAQDNYDTNGNPTGERTYHAQNIVTITVRDVTRAGDVIDAAVKAGANNINGLTFGIADTSELANQARELAIVDARARAQQIASALGIKVGDVITVNESISSDNQPLPIMALGVGGGGGASVSQGQLTVSVQVTITFAIAT